MTSINRIPAYPAPPTAIARDLSRRQRTALRRAVAEAEGWRGSLIGNPDPEPLAEFDQFIADAKAALRAIGIRPSR